MTAYDRQTHALIRGMSRAESRIERHGGPEKSRRIGGHLLRPGRAGGKASNWVPTDPQGQFELLYRLYGPKKDFFEKTWKLPDVEVIQ